MSDQDREVLSVTIQRRLHQITGVKPGIATIRSQVRPVQPVRANHDTPTWCKSWAYILSHKCYEMLRNVTKCYENMQNVMKCYGNFHNIFITFWSVRKIAAIFDKKSIESALA